MEIAFLSLFNSLPGKMLDDSTNFNDLNSETENKNDLNEKLTENITHPLCVDSKQINLEMADKNYSIINNKKFNCELCNFNEICEAKNDTNPTVKI